MPDGPREILPRPAEGTRTVCATTKNRRATTTKLELTKYDPKLRKQVLFREVKV